MRARPGVSRSTISPVLLKGASLQLSSISYLSALFGMTLPNDSILLKPSWVGRGHLWRCRGCHLARLSPLLMCEQVMNSILFYYFVQTVLRFFPKRLPLNLHRRSRLGRGIPLIAGRLWIWGSTAWADYQELKVPELRPVFHSATEIFQ
jgi:hypothetical protein